MASWDPFLINIPLHEVEALQLSLAQAVDLLNVLSETHLIFKVISKTTEDSLR